MTEASPAAPQAARPGPSRGVRRAARGLGARRLRQPGAARAAARARHHRPRRRLRHRIDLRHLPHPRPARRGHRPCRRAAPPNTSTRCCWICCGSAPTNCCAPVSTHTPRCPPPSSRPASNSIRHERVSSTACCAPLPRATSSPGSPSWPRLPTPTPSATWRSCTPIRAGSPRRSPTRSAPMPAELDALLASDDERPLVHLAARPGVLTADELAEAVDGNGRPLLAVRGVPARRRPGSVGRRPRRCRAGAGRGQPAGGQGADARRLSTTTAAAGWTCARVPAARPRCWRRSAPIRRARHRGRTHARRADLVEQNTRGLPVDVLRVDGRDPGLEPGFDRVLVDAPCTGLGALRRRPEARWRRQPGDVPALARLQRELLASAIQLTRPGGVVLYATCSPHLAETVGVVADALRRHPVTALDTRPLFEPVENLGSDRDGSLRAAVAAPARHRCHVRGRPQSPMSLLREEQSEASKRLG